MNIKDIIIPVLLSILIVFGVRYYFSSGTKTAGETAGFVAPETKQEYEPLNKEIEFIKDERFAPEQLTEVQTDWARLTFSTDGAILKSLSFKRNIDGKDELITTIDAVAQGEMHAGCFILALQENTPFYYTLVDRKYTDADVQLRYEASIQGGKIAKTFIVHKDRYLIDVKIDVDSSKTVQPRIFFNSPHMKELGDNDTISAVMVNRYDKFEKIGRSGLDQQSGWYVPTLFGTDSRYFVHACCADQNSFAKRAYYKFVDAQAITSILEGPSVDHASSWILSFYMGPKESAAFVPVDPRLEQTMEYSGLLAPIARILLMILNWLYDYVHNYGLAIILLTFLIKLILLPFSLKGEQSMKKQREFQKKVAYLQQKHKANPELLAQERAELMRKHGMGGMLGGCLPVLLQVPIFFALSRVLNSSFELYQAPMLWIPDLSAADPLYILPLFVALVMVLNALMAQDNQQMLTGIVMGLVFGAISANFSAGLALYIGMSALLGIVQTKILRAFNIA